MAFNSQMDMMKMQQQIKENSADIQNLVSDLSDWSTEITAKEKQQRIT